MTTHLNPWTGGTIGSPVQSDLGAAGGGTPFDTMSTPFPKYASVGGETVAQIDGPALTALFNAGTVTTQQAIARRSFLTARLKLRNTVSLSVAPSAEIGLERGAHGTQSGAELGQAFYLTMQTTGRLKLAIAGNSSAWLSANLYPGSQFRYELYLEAGVDGSGNPADKIRVTTFADRFSSVIVEDSNLLVGNVLSTSRFLTTLRRFNFGGGSYPGIYNVYPGAKSAIDAPDAVNAVDPMVAATNTAPTASVATSNAVVGKVTLDSTAADADGSIASYAWTCTGWPSGSTQPAIAVPSAADTYFLYTAAGTYSGQLVVTDNGGATVTKTWSVTVAAPAAAAAPSKRLVYYGGVFQ